MKRVELRNLNVINVTSPLKHHYLSTFLWINHPIQLTGCDTILSYKFWGITPKFYDVENQAFG